jgi:hypothetical protein
MSSWAHYSWTPLAYAPPPPQCEGPSFTLIQKKARFLLSDWLVSAKWTLVMSVTLLSKILIDNVSPFQFSICSLQNNYMYIQSVLHYTLEHLYTVHIHISLTYLNTHTYTFVCYSVWQYIIKLYKCCSISPVKYSFNIRVLYWWLKFTQLLSCH